MEEAIANHVIGSAFIKDIKNIIRIDEIIKIKKENLSIETNNDVADKNVEKKNTGF